MIPPTLVHMDVVMAGYSSTAGVLSGIGGRVNVHGGLQESIDALLRHATVWRVTSVGFSCRLSESVGFDPCPLDIEVTVPPDVVVPGIFVSVASLLLSSLVLLNRSVVPWILELLLARPDEFDSSELLEEDVPVDEVLAVRLDVELREMLSGFSLDCVP